MIYCIIKMWNERKYDNKIILVRICWSTIIIAAKTTKAKRTSINRFEKKVSVIDVLAQKETINLIEEERMKPPLMTPLIPQR